MTIAPDPASFRIAGFGARAWNPRTGGPIDPVDREVAQARHEAGEPYAVLLTAAPEGLALPLATVTLNENGVTVGFHRHDAARSDLAHMWHPGDDGRLRPVQVDRRAGNKRAVPRDQLVYEYLKLSVHPAKWVRMTDAGTEVLGERDVDLDAVALAPPAFGDYAAYLDVGLSERLWPGLPELAWVGPEAPLVP